MTDAILPEPEFLREILDYDPETGLLTWKVRGVWLFTDGKQTAQHNAAIWNGKNAGKLAGCRNLKGYIVLGFGTRLIRAHRIAWAITHGAWPESEIDHINHDRADNRIANLRVVGRKDNMKNISLRPESKSGVSGVSWCKNRKKWQVAIHDGEKRVALGRYDILADAVAARKAAEVRLGYHENHGA